MIVNGEKGRGAGQGECKRCGICCRASTPTLYESDLPLVREGVLPRESLMTLRAGETVHSNRLGSTFELEQDLVKLRSVPDHGCMMLDGDQCIIHLHHPLQCRHLQCWSGRDAGDLEQLPRLRRQALFAEDDLALRLMQEYDVKVPAARLSRLFTQISRGSRGQIPEAVELLDLDHRLRLGIASRHGYDPQLQHLLLGRPAIIVARAHGLVVVLRRGKPTLQVQA